MMSAWGYSSPRPSARNDEVIKLTQRISSGEREDGMVVIVFKSQSNQEKDDLSDIENKKMY